MLFLNMVCLTVALANILPIRTYPGAVGKGRSLPQQNRGDIAFEAGFRFWAISRGRGGKSDGNDISRFKGHLSLG
jgi:hypothetical protein